MHIFNRLALSILLIATFCGCTSRTKISTVRITDPDGGISFDVPVQTDGTFSQEMKKDKVVSVASGSVSDSADSHSVALVYERRLYTAPGKFASEKLETTFTAKPDTEVPIGKNPSKSEAEQATANNALANLKVELLKGQ